MGKRGGKLDQNLNDAVNKLSSVLTDKDLSKLIIEVRGKVDKIEELIEGMDEVSSEDLQNLKELSKSIYKITAKYKI